MDAQAARRFARVLGRGLLAGVFLGIGGRAVMRAIGLVAGLPPGFSVGGSIEVVAAGALFGGPVAVAFLLVRSRWKTRGWWPGIVAGLALEGALIALPPGAARGALTGTPIHPAVALGLFALVFAAYGVVLELLWRKRSE